MHKSPYQKFLIEKSDEELREIAHIKRFLECYSGDADFREKVYSGQHSLKQLARNRNIKLSDLESLRPVFDPQFAHFRQDATTDTWPLTAKWDEYYLTVLNTLPYYAQMGDSDGEFKAFDEWRQKQVVRTLFDVGASASRLVHPPVAFELSDGCSVGCWFCGISADKFNGHFNLDEDGANPEDFSPELVHQN
jgi:hypothetical protein